MIKNTTSLLTMCIILLFGCSANQGIIGNSAVIAKVEEVSNLSLLGLEGNVKLKMSDLDSLSKLIEKDQLASHYVESLEWMLAHNETEHLGHTLDFLKYYVKTGKESHCTPHELWHASMYLRYNESEKVEHAAEDAQESFPMWVDESYEKQKKYPQFYLRLDSQIAEVEYAIKQLQQKNYSKEMEMRIDKLGETAIC